MIQVRFEHTPPHETAAEWEVIRNGVTLVSGCTSRWSAETILEHFPAWREHLDEEVEVLSEEGSFSPTTGIYIQSGWSSEKSSLRAFLTEDLGEKKFEELFSSS